MSAHPLERLSAYLDDALPEKERAAVQAHLATCPDCSRQLAELAALDAAARAEPAEPPAGYFDALPGRVVRRIRAEARPARTARALPFRLPVWSWAAAAALLVAVLAPLTWRASGPIAPVSRREAEAPAIPQQAAPVAGLGYQPAPAAPTVAPRPAATVVAGIERQAPAPERRPVLVGTPADEQAIRSKEAKLERTPSALSEAVAEAPARGERDRLAQAEPTRTQTAVPPQALPEEVVVEAPPPAPAAPPARTERTDAAKAAPAAVPATGFAPPPPRESAEAKGDRGRGASGALAGRAAAKPKVQANAFDALAARRPPRTAAEARALREAWHAFLAGPPDGSQADQARVGAIEAGLAAWRLGGDPADREAARVEAEAYLARPDAAQAERVRALLASLQE